jgi:hypothetical protein
MIGRTKAMSIYTWIIIWLAAFDLALCAVLYGLMRRSAGLSRGTLVPMGLGLSAFVFHAFMFFSGAILILQLATVMAIFGIVSVEVGRRRSPSR